MISRLLHWLTHWLDRPWPELSQDDLPGTDTPVRHDLGLWCSYCHAMNPCRWAPSPDAGPHWRCSECGEVVNERLADLLQPRTDAELAAYEPPSTEVIDAAIRQGIADRDAAEHVTRRRVNVHTTPRDSLFDDLPRMAKLARDRQERLAVKRVADLASLQKKLATARTQHITNDVGECINWCPACGPQCAHGNNSFDCPECNSPREWHQDRIPPRSCSGRGASRIDYGEFPWRRYWHPCDAGGGE